jgi:hypothetical protein
VDEADRLLRQDYQGWLPEVLRQINPLASNQQQQQQQQQQQAQGQVQQPDASSTSCSASGFLSPLLPCSGTNSSSSPRLLKLVVSATLTRDPSKLLRLQLHYPRYITLADVAHRWGVQQVKACNDQVLLGQASSRMLLLRINIQAEVGQVVSSSHTPVTCSVTIFKIA